MKADWWAWWRSLAPGDRLLLALSVSFLLGGMLGLVSAPFAVVLR